MNKLTRLAKNRYVAICMVISLLVPFAYSLTIQCPCYVRYHEVSTVDIQCTCLDPELVGVAGFLPARCGDADAFEADNDYQEHSDWTDSNYYYTGHASAGRTTSYLDGTYGWERSYYCDMTASQQTATEAAECLIYAGAAGAACWVAYTGSTGGLGSTTFWLVCGPAWMTVYMSCNSCSDLGPICTLTANAVVQIPNENVSGDTCATSVYQ